MITTPSILLVAVLTLWLGLNCLAPYMVMMTATKISPGRLPVELFTKDEARRVRFYLKSLSPGGYGYSVWAPPCWHVVVVDESFFAYAASDVVRYVVAHELGHYRLGHHWRRWWIVVTGVVLLPWCRRLLARYEDEANAYAASLTGITMEQSVEIQQQANERSSHG